MGKMCPILNHPLIDGVLIKDDALVKYINKNNTEFVPTELVCRSCKRELVKLYNKKMQRAIQLKRGNYSVSSLEKNKTWSSTSSERSLSRHGTLQRGGIGMQFKKTIPMENRSTTNVTIRKKLVRDINVQVPNLTVVASVAIEATTNSRILRSNASANQIGAPNEDDVIIRLSQEPTTSKAVNLNKRRISAIVDTDDDDDGSLSLNAINGTLLPNIQPIPPKRKPENDRQTTLQQDIWHQYVSDINGG